MTTQLRRGTERKLPEKPRKFRRFVGTAMLATSLVLMPAAVKSNPATAQTTQQESAKKSAKKTLYSLLDYLKTKDKKYSKEVTESLDDGQKDELKSLVEGRLDKDPGLSKFIYAFSKDKEDFDSVEIVEAILDLYSMESEDEAVKKYGEDVVKAFKNMVLWRLASHAVDTYKSAFNYETITEAKEEYARIESEIELLGLPLSEHEYFIKTFQELFGERMGDEFNSLWAACWKTVGDDIGLVVLIESMEDCKNILDTEGVKGAKKKYNKEFIILVSKVLAPKKEAQSGAVEEALAEEETTEEAEKKEEPPPELAKVGEIKGLPDYDKYVDKYSKKKEKPKPKPPEKPKKKKKGKKKKKK